MKHETNIVDLSDRWNKYKTKAKCNLNLYSPTILEDKSTEAIRDHDGAILYYGKPIFDEDEKRLLDFDPAEYSNFTLVLNRDGSLWYEANRFLVDLVKYDVAYLETQRISKQTIDNLASGLQKYKWFCDERDEEKLNELLNIELGKEGLPTKEKINDLTYKSKHKQELSEDERKQLPLLKTWLIELQKIENMVRKQQSKKPPFWKVAKRPTSRPNHLYRQHLIKLIHNGELADTTAAKYLYPITDFYDFVIKEYGSSYLVLGNRVTMPGKVTNSLIKKDSWQGIKEGNEANRVPKGNNGTKNNLGYIRDGGNTKPLSEVQQKELFALIQEINQPEMIYSHLFAVIVAARVRTVFTLRLCHFMKSLPADDSPASLDAWRRENDIYKVDEEYSIKVGPSELVDTKGLDAEYRLRVPGNMMKMMQLFCMSERTRHRRTNIKFPQSDPLHEYVFITKNFNPYYCAKGDPNKSKYENLPDGNAMRQFNATEITPKINFEYKFHFLRATALWNMLQNLIKHGISEDEALKDVQNFAGHKNKETTKKYLDWKPNEELRYRAFDEHAKKLYKWAGIEINNEDETAETKEEVPRNPLLIADGPSKEDLLAENEKLKAEIEYLKNIQKNVPNE